MDLDAAIHALLRASVGLWGIVVGDGHIPGNTGKIVSRSILYDYSEGEISHIFVKDRDGDPVVSIQYQ